MTEIQLHELKMIGEGLSRPECVLSTKDGSLFVSDWRGGVCHIRPDGSQVLILARNAPFPLLPNGIALLQDGSFLLANLGPEGGVWRLFPDGNAEPFLSEIDGVPLPPCNYVMIDRIGRVWITVSTMIQPRANAYRKGIADGFIVRVDKKGPQVVATGLGYTNEVQIDQSGDWLYVNETFARKLSRFCVNPDGSLGRKQLVLAFGKGCFPDGLAFDQEGGVWIVSIISNRVIRIDRQGKSKVIIEDSDKNHLDWVEQAYQNDKMNRSHLDSVRSAKLGNISSIAFGGPDLRKAYLGCLLQEQIAFFNSPVAGLAPVHWDWSPS